MKGHSTRALVILGVCMFMTCVLSARAQAQAPKSTQKEALVTRHATGPFEVKVTPADSPSGDASLGRMILDKQYHGDLEASGKGQMLTASTSVKGSGAYVAIERVTGTLQGRTGSFTLQHSGLMSHGAPQLTITVVPDSGGDQLAGIAGKMTINIAADGKHSYDFEYMLPGIN